MSPCIGAPATAKDLSVVTVLLCIFIRQLIPCELATSFFTVAALPTEVCSHGKPSGDTLLVNSTKHFLNLGITMAHYESMCSAIEANYLMTPSGHS